MTVFATPLASLPNAGTIRRPDTAAAEHRSALAGLATLDDDAARRTAVEAYATRAHDAQNAQLRTTARQVLRTLDTAENSARTAIDRHRAGIADTEDVKAVVSNDRLVRRDRTARLMAGFSTLLVVAAYLFTEAKLLGQVVMTSGLLGLLPDSPWDQVFAYAFAGTPLALAVAKYAWQERLATAPEREAHLRKLWFWGTRVGIPSWIAAVVLLFGPALVPGLAALDDPFAARPEIAQAVSTTVLETRRILQHLAGLLPILLLFGILVGASNLIAAIWISHRETAARAMREDVRHAETCSFRTEALDSLLRDQIETDASIGRLSGLVEQIDADRATFAELLLNTVEAMRSRGELARRSAILDAAEGRVIEAGPLFARQ